MANVEAIRVAEEASSANLVLKAKVRKLDRLPPQVTPYLTLNTPHEHLQFEIPPATKADHIRGRCRATIQCLLSSYVRHRRERLAGCPPVERPLIPKIRDLLLNSQRLSSPLLLFF